MNIYGEQKILFGGCAVAYFRRGGWRRHYGDMLMMPLLFTPIA